MVSNIKGINMHSYQVIPRAYGGSPCSKFCMIILWCNSWFLYMSLNWWIHLSLWNL